MKKRLLLAATLLGVILFFVVAGVGYSKVHPSFDEGGDLEIFQDARISYIMGNPDGFLLVYFTYSNPELGPLIGLQLKYPEGVDTVGKVLVRVYDTRGVFSGKSGASLLAQFPQLSNEIEVFLNSPTTETLYLSDFFFSFLEKRQNSDEYM